MRRFSDWHAALRCGGFHPAIAAAILVVITLTSFALFGEPVTAWTFVPLALVITYGIAIGRWAWLEFRRGRRGPFPPALLAAALLLPGEPSAEDAGEEESGPGNHHTPFQEALPTYLGAGMTLLEFRDVTGSSWEVLDTEVWETDRFVIAVHQLALYDPWLGALEAAPADPWQVIDPGPAEPSINPVVESPVWFDSVFTPLDEGELTIWMVIDKDLPMTTVAVRTDVDEVVYRAQSFALGSYPSGSMTVTLSEWQDYLLLASPSALDEARDDADDCAEVTEAFDEEAAAELWMMAGALYEAGELWSCGTMHSIETVTSGPTIAAAAGTFLAGFGAKLAAPQTPPVTPLTAAKEAAELAVGGACLAIGGAMTHRLFFAPPGAACGECGEADDWIPDREPIVLLGHPSAGVDGMPTESTGWSLGGDAFDFCATESARDALNDVQESDGTTNAGAEYWWVGVVDECDQWEDEAPDDGPEEGTPCEEFPDLPGCEDEDDGDGDAGGGSIPNLGGDGGGGGGCGGVQTSIDTPVTCENAAHPTAPGCEATFNYLYDDDGDSSTPKASCTAILSGCDVSTNGTICSCSYASCPQDDGMGGQYTPPITQPPS